MKNIKIYKIIKRTKFIPFVIAGTILGGCATAEKVDSLVVAPSITVSPTITPTNTPVPTKNVIDDTQFDNNQKDSTNVDVIYQPIFTPTPVVTKIPIELENKLLKENIIINQVEFNDIKNSILYETNYDYSNYFNIKNSIEQFEQYEYKSVISDNVIIDNKVDLNRLYEIVLNNNLHYERKQNYDKFSDEQIYNFCKIICESLNEKIDNKEINLNDLDYVLSNLKIFGYTGFVYATIKDDNCLIINEKMIDSLNQVDGLEKTLKHESMHLIQMTTDNNLIGINYKSPNLKVNALYNKWFFEASAEKTSLNDNEKELTYTGEINYLNALNVASINSSVKVEEFNFTKNLEDFYALFSCDGTISKEEIISMMYSINFITLEDKTFLKENNIRLDAYATRDLKYKYASQVCETLSKKFYYDLAVMLKDGRSLEEIFSLIALFENVCLNQTFYTDQYRLESNVDFINNYVKIQDVVFNMLADKLNINLIEVYDLYNQYNNRKNITITCTNKDEYLNEIYLRIKHNQGHSINYMYNNNIQKLQNNR